MQKLFTLLVCAVISFSLLSCGPAKKKDSEDELGISDGRLRDGKGGGNDKPNPPVSFENYCKGLKGQLLTPAMCVHELKSFVEQAPKDFNFGIYSKDLIVGRRGWTIQTSGDPNGAVALFTVINGVNSKFLDIDRTVRKQRLEVDAVGLRIIATQEFAPVTIKIYECVDMEHHQIMCNPF